MFKAAVLTLLSLTAVACSSSSRLRTVKNAKQAFNAEGRTSKTLDISFFEQQEKECGPTSLYTIINYYNPRSIKFEKIKSMTMTPGFDGAMKRDLLAAARRAGYAFYQIKSPEAHIKAVEQNQPVLVFQNLGLGFSPIWHFSVMTGFKTKPDKVLAHDGKVPNREFTPSRFFKAWDRGKKWSYLVTPPELIPEGRSFKEVLNNASAFLNLKDSSSAEKILIAANKKWPKRFEIYAGLGNTFADTNTKKALSYYDRALSLAPNHKGLINNRKELLKKLSQN